VKATGSIDSDGNFVPDAGIFEHHVPPDGMWIVVFGTKGYVGLVLLYIVLEFPVILFLRHFPVQLWNQPRVAAATLAAAVLGICMIDYILNGFLNIIYVTLAGSLIGLRPAQLGLSLTGMRGAGAMGRAGSLGLGGAAVGRIAAPADGTGRREDHGSPSPRRAGSGPLRLADRSRSLGRALREEGRLAEAEVAWRHALDLLTTLAAGQPESPDLQRRWCDCANDLAWLQLNHPEPARHDPASALALARRVVEWRADCGAYWNTLGVAYLRAGDARSAVAALDRATALTDGGTAFDDVFLAMAHARLGDREQARHRLDQALLRMEHDYPGHPELARFCAEAQSILATGTAAPVAAP
jgi:tetratricopeptide (TPR) repeat protein